MKVKLEIRLPYHYAIELVEKAARQYLPSTKITTTTGPYPSVVRWIGHEGWRHTCYIKFEVYGSPYTETITGETCGCSSRGTEMRAVLDTVKLKANELA